MADFISEANKPFQSTFLPTLEGNPGSVDPNTPLVWSVDPASGITITPDEGALTATIIGTVPAVDVVITAKGDGNDTDAVLDVVATATVTITEVPPVITANAATLAFAPVA
jgi:hypothetical protein